MFNSNGQASLLLMTEKLFTWTKSGKHSLGLIYMKRAFEYTVLSALSVSYFLKNPINRFRFQNHIQDVDITTLPMCSKEYRIKFLSMKGL